MFNFNQKTMNKKLLVFIAAFLVLAGGGYTAKKYLIDKKSPFPSPTGKADKALYSEYLKEAMKYRTEGFGGDANAFNKALDAYKKAIEVSEEKEWLAYYNLGNTYRLVKDYNFAGESYAKALENAPAESTIYLAKIEMYRYELNKPYEEINTIYEEALKKVTDSVNIMISYATFLKEEGKYSEALKYYKTLSEKYPDNQGYKDEISELESKVK